MWDVAAAPLGPTLSALVALAPLALILAGLGVARAPAHRVCPVALLVCLVLATVAWRMPPRLALLAALEGAALAAWPILWVIFAAIFTYNVTHHTRAMKEIKSLLVRVGEDRRVQVLLIAWGFGGFLEGVAGFGTAVAISAGVLIGLGFEPFLAAVLCLFANTAPVAFGGAGLPVITLAHVTGLEQGTLARDAVLQLTPFTIAIPFVLVLILTRGRGGFSGVGGACLAAGLGFAVPQFVIAHELGPEAPTIVGALCAMLAVALWVRARPPRRTWRFAGEAGESPAAGRPAPSAKLQVVAWSPYWLMLVFLLGTSAVVPRAHSALAKVASAITIYDGPGGGALGFLWILTPGTPIFVAAILGGMWQGASPRHLLGVLCRTARQLRFTAVTVASIVALARVMGHSGMISAIAAALAALAGPFYPLVAPAIGALGAFVTGSDTSSNVLLGVLQQKTAAAIGADPGWIAAANATGATAGKMISPQSIAVAAAATGQPGGEARLLRAMIGYCALYAAILGLVVWLGGLLRAS